MAFPLAQVLPHNGAPALFINGEPVFPFFLMTGPRVLSELQALAPLTTHLHTDVFPLGWQGIARHEYSGFDTRVREFLARDKDALLLPRLHLDAPDDWMEAYPGELVAYADPRAWDGETC